MKLIIKLSLIINIGITLLYSKTILYKKKVRILALKEMLQKRLIKSDQKNEQFKEKMEALNSLETEEERMNRRIRDIYVFFTGMVLSVILLIITVLIEVFSIPPFQSVAIFNPRWILFSTGITISPLLIIVLYAFISSFKKYRMLKKRYIQKFGSKPEISSIAYVCTPSLFCR